MGEVDTKSIDSVHLALSLFGETNDPKKGRPSSKNLDKENEIEDLMKDLNNIKFQLEAKNSVHKQTLVRLDHSQKTVDKLFILLKNTEFERDMYINDCREAKLQINKLQTRIEEIEGELLETAKIQDEHSHVLSVLKSTREELVNAEEELVAVSDAKFDVMKQAEVMETALKIEKEKAVNLLRHVSELNETIIHFQLDAVEAEKVKDVILSEKQAELVLVKTSLVKAQEELETMRKQLKLMQNLENELIHKSLHIESMQLELQRETELHNSAEKAHSDAVNDINQLIADMEILTRKNSDKDSQINLLEMDLSRLKLEGKNANENVDHLNRDAKKMTGMLQKVRSELDEIKGRETDAQVEIALLKSELHRGRSKTAAAEAAEQRAKCEMSALKLVVEQLESEVEEAKKEIQRLEEGKWTEETQHTSCDEEVADVDESNVNMSDDDEVIDSDESKTEDKRRGDITNTHIRISVEEYENLVKKAEKAGEAEELDFGSKCDMERMKKELEITTAKIGEFRTQAEEAACRAEVAEKAKAALEDKIRKWRERRERRKAAMEALREESVYMNRSFTKELERPKIYQPLGKILKMKF